MRKAAQLPNFQIRGGQGWIFHIISVTEPVLVKREHTHQANIRDPYRIRILALQRFYMCSRLPRDGSSGVATAAAVCRLPCWIETCPCLISWFGTPFSAGCEASGREQAIRIRPPFRTSEEEEEEEEAASDATLRLPTLSGPRKAKNGTVSCQPP